jgi:hypothetical protein
MKAWRSLARNVIAPILFVFGLLFAASIAANDPRTTPPLGYTVF